MTHTLLLVEDNPNNQKLMRLVLEQAGYRVVAATTAPEALALAETVHPQLVLMDIQLPGMDGLTATKIMKSNPKTAAIKVIAVTAFAMKGDEEKAVAAGCDGYFSKPIRYRELLQAIADFLSPEAAP